MRTHMAGAVQIIKDQSTLKNKNMIHAPKLMVQIIKDQSTLKNQVVR